MSTAAQESFIESVKEASSLLTEMKFAHHSTIRKGYSTYIDYKRKGTMITFMFGPSDWDVEILIIIGARKYAFKDLLQIPSIHHWVSSNRYEQRSKRIIKDEVIWFIKLLQFALPKIESAPDKI